MNHATETIATLDTGVAPVRCRRQRRACRARRIEGQRSVGPVAVVVVGEDVEDALEMLLLQAAIYRKSVFYDVFISTVMFSFNISEKTDTKSSSMRAGTVGQVLGCQGRKPVF